MKGAASVRVMLIKQCPLFLEGDVLGGLLALLVKGAWFEFSIFEELEQLSASSSDSFLKFCTYHWTELGSRNPSLSKKRQKLEICAKELVKYKWRPEVTCLILFIQSRMVIHRSANQGLPHIPPPLW